jgi:hypothetical protein
MSRTTHPSLFTEDLPVDTHVAILQTLAAAEGTLRAVDEQACEGEA